MNFLSIFLKFTNEPVDFSFSGPRCFVSGEEDLHGDTFAVPQTAPHFTVAAFADALAQRDLFGHRPLNEQRHARTAARSHRVFKHFLQIQKQKKTKLKT